MSIADDHTFAVPALCNDALYNVPAVNLSCHNLVSSVFPLLLTVHVFVSVKPGTEVAFKQASLANARQSAKEPGIARFDVIQQVDDPTKFVLVEVYKNADAPTAHKETDHYNTWREAVADMMAEPRTAIKYKNLFPVAGTGWDYGDATLE